MKKRLPDAEWLRTLPRKRMGVAVLFFNDKSELLVVKQTYKDKWSVTGGVIDENESPKAAAIRETFEEIGINVPEMQFLGVEYVPPIDDAIEGLEFVFSGGVVTAEQIEHIILEENEISEYKFLSVEDALPILRTGLQRRIPHCLEALKKNSPIYFEFSDKA